MNRTLALFLALSLALPAARTFASEPARASQAQASGATPMAPLSQDRFFSLLTRDLAAHYSLEGDLQLELIRPFETPDRPARRWELALSDYPAVPSAAMLVRCRIVADGSTVSDTTLVLRASLWRDAWAARLPVANGATFDPSSLDIRRVDQFRDRDVVPASVGDHTFVFSRSVQAGRLLTWRDIARRPLVRKGDFVEVSAADGMLSVSMKGLAMQNGAQGEAITVRNPDSKKDFTAFVIDENRVQVRF